MSADRATKRAMSSAGAINNMSALIQNGLPLTDGPVISEGMSLLELASQLNDLANKEGKILSSLKLNGIQVDITRLEPTVKIKSDDKVEITTTSPFELAKHSLKDAIHQFPDFEKDIDFVIDSLIRGDKENSFKRFGVFISDFKGIIELLQTLENTFDFDFDEIKINGKSIHEISESLEKVLLQVKSSMENEDYVTLTDLLEYEIKNLFADHVKKCLELLLDLLNNNEDK